MNWFSTISKMYKTELTHILVCCCLIIQALPQTTPPPEICNSNGRTSLGVHVPSTLCELPSGQCTYALWNEPPSCSYTQLSLPQCPDGFLETDHFCYTFPPKAKFLPPCPFDGVSPFLSVIAEIPDQLPEPVWLPVTRNLSNGFDLFRWVEPSTLYKSEYSNDTLFYDDFKNCVVYLSSQVRTSASCSEEYSRLCAYQKLISVDNKVCQTAGNCHQSHFSSKSTCFCLDNAQSQHPKAEFAEPYQNTVYTKLTKEICTMGLVKYPNGSYLWARSNQEITYTYWSPDVISDSTNVYGAQAPDGWVLTESETSCLVVEQQVPEPETFLKLVYDSNSRSFTLTVANSVWLSSDSVFCFSGADPSDLLYRLPNLIGTADMSTYTFKPINDLPGFYWCEAFKYTNLEIVKSNKLFFRNPKYYEFVAIFQVKLPTGVFLNSNLFPFLEENILTKYYINETRYWPRIVKIPDWDQVKNLIWVNIHFSVLLEISDTMEEQEFYSLKDTINADQTHFVKLLDLLSSDFCMSETFPSTEDFHLSWPTTPADVKAYPKEFCFRDDGTLITRLCSGDFTNGARWMNITNCQILKQSKVSTDLLPLYYNQNLGSNQASSQILQLFDSHSVDDFAPLDVYLIEEIFWRYKATDFDLGLFGQVVENILKIDKAVLLESQLVARTTDKILYIIDCIMKHHQDPFKIITNNFVFVLTQFKDIHGMYVQLLDGKRNVITYDWTLEPLWQEIENLEVAIWLTPELSEQINSSSKVGFTVFFNDAFFGDASYNTVATVFGVYMSQGEPLPGSVKILQSIDFDGTTNAFCVNWMYQIDTLRGFWRKNGDLQKASSFQVCDFRRSANVALIVELKDSSNVTDELQDLLASSYVDSERMSKLAELTEQYDKFEAVDVSLLGQVLQLVEDTNTDLGVLAKIVDNVHRIEPSVLSESQQKDKATDAILYHIDAIIKNNLNQSQTLITTDNFVLFVSNLNQTNLTGLVLCQSNNSFRTDVLTGDFDFAHLQSYNDLRSSVMLSSELKNQMGQDAKVIVTIFLSDVLFNQENLAQTSVGAIFGVVLPDPGNYSGVVSIFHNVSGTKSKMECAHWNYLTPNQNQSYWKKDCGAENKSFLVQCNFAHTTHFALLVLDENRYLTQHDILDWITTINCAISLISLCFVFLTALLFQKWRRNLGNQILLNFSFAIILQIVTFYIAGTINRHSGNQLSCTLIGVFLHYSIISQFCWMLIIANLQFKRFVKVFGTSPKYLLLKACVWGWVVPLVPVLLILLLDQDNYVNGKMGFCYPSGLGLYLGVWLPIALIGSINFVVFVYIIYNIFCINCRKSVAGDCSDKKYQFGLFVLLFFMFGLTWTFGFLSELDSGIVFVFLFCSTATLQGFVLFLYFIVFNANTRRLYVDSIKGLFRTNDL